MRKTNRTNEVRLGTLKSGLIVALLPARGAVVIMDDRNGVVGATLRRRVPRDEPIDATIRRLEAVWGDRLALAGWRPVTGKSHLTP